MTTERQLAMARTRGFTAAGIAQIPDSIARTLGEYSGLSKEQETLADEAIGLAKLQLRQRVDRSLPEKSVEIVEIAVSDCGITPRPWKT